MEFIKINRCECAWECCIRVKALCEYYQFWERYESNARKFSQLSV